MSDDRNRLIYERHEKGETLLALANEYGLTKQRIHQIYVREDLINRMHETDDILMKLVYKYSHNYSDLYILTKILDDNNIKTVFDLVSVSIDDINIAYFSYTSNEYCSKLITRVKNKANVIVKKMEL